MKRKITTKNYYLPDIMVVCDKNGIKPDGVYATPRFVAEITSKSTRKDDYNSKREVYREIGVQEYWIIDLQKKLIIKNTLDDEVYLSEMVRYPNTSWLNVDTYPGLNISLSAIFDFLM